MQLECDKLEIERTADDIEWQGFRAEAEMLLTRMDTV